MKGREARFITPLDVLLYLRSAVAIKGMSTAELVELAGSVKERSIPAGETILAADEPVKKAYILVEGKVEVDTGGYKEQVVPPAGFNWLRLHGRFDTSHQARALEDCLLLELDAGDVLKQLERNPSMIERLLQIYSARILALRGDLPLRPEKAGIAEPGSPPVRELDLVERLSRIAGPDGYWRDANLDAVIGLVREMSEVRFPKGEVLWERGWRSTDSLIIVSGTVVCANERGEQVEVGTGFNLGFMHAVANLHRTYSAVATRDVILLRTDVNELLAILEHHSDLALDLLAAVSRELASEYEASKLRNDPSSAAGLSLADPGGGAAERSSSAS